MGGFGIFAWKTVNTDVFSLGPQIFKVLDIIPGLWPLYAT
jgi:hypothetical protein